MPNSSEHSWHSSSKQLDVSYQTLISLKLRYNHLVGVVSDCEIHLWLLHENVDELTMLTKPVRHAANPISQAENAITYITITECPCLLSEVSNTIKYIPRILIQFTYIDKHKLLFIFQWWLKTTQNRSCLCRCTWQ